MKALQYLTLALFLLAPVRGLACQPGTIPLVQIEELTDKAMTAYADGDHSTFKIHAHQVAVQLECLQHLITPKKAVEIHALMGLLARVEKDIVRAKLAFTAARTIDPNWKIENLRVPDSDPATADFNKAVSLKKRTTEELPKPFNGRLRFDGVQSLDRPTDLPVIFQRLDSANKPRKSLYLWPGMKVPEYNTKKKQNSKKIIY